MNLNRIWLILRYEYWQNLRRRAFLFTAFVMPLFILAVTTVSGRMGANAAEDLGAFRQVGYVDAAGVLASVDPATVSEDITFIPYTDADAANAAVQAGTLQGYFVLPPDYRSSGTVQFYADQGIPLALELYFSDLLTAGIAAQMGESPLAARLQNPIDDDQLQVQFLGEAKAVEQDGLLYRFAIPLGFVMLLVISLLTTTQFLMTGTVEEKENRIAEVLLTSVRPGELMLGKLLGLGALALTQIGYLLLIGSVGAVLTDRVDMLRDLNVAPTDIALALLYFFLSFFLLSAISLIIGASASAEAESRQIAGVFTLITIAPVYGVMFSVVNGNVDNLLVRLMSLFPLTAPTANLLLIALGEDTAWQTALSLLILVVTILLVLWLAAKIFRQAMLVYDARLSLRQLRQIVMGRD